MKKSDIDRILGRTKGTTKETEKENEGILGKVTDFAKDKGVLGKAGLTYLDAVGNLYKGIGKSLEGIYDAGVGVVGGV